MRKMFNNTTLEVNLVACGVATIVISMFGIIINVWLLWVAAKGNDLEDKSNCLIALLVVCDIDNCIGYTQIR